MKEQNCNIDVLVTVEDKLAGKEMRHTTLDQIEAWGADQDDIERVRNGHTLTIQTFRITTTIKRVYPLEPRKFVPTNVWRDPDDLGGTGHYDISYSDADGGL